MPRDPASATWRAAIDLATLPPAPQRRLLITEVDRLPIDDVIGTDPGFADRLVYAEAIDLP